MTVDQKKGWWLHPEPIGHWRAYGECFRHREDARWSFRSQYETREGRQPEKAEVDQGVVRCPLDETCRFGGAA